MPGEGVAPHVAESIAGLGRTSMQRAHRDRVPAGARRPARRRGHRRAAVPRRRHVDARRLPGRRPLLRAQRLPDHDVAARGVGPHGPHRLGRVLVAPSTALPPGARTRPRRHPAVRGRVRRAVAARRRCWRRLVADVRGELAIRVLRPELLLAVRQPSPFRHMWSLAIEEQFYLVWPFVVLVSCGAARVSSSRAGVRRRALASEAFDGSARPPQR